MLFAVWLHIGCVNSWGFGAEGLTVKPVMAALWCFVPLANLFMPYRATREIFQVAKNPTRWQTQKLPPSLFLWWSCCVLGAILVVLYLQSIFFPSGGKADPERVVLLGVALNVLLVVGAILAMKVFKRILRFQDRLVGISPKDRKPKSGARRKKRR